MNTKIFYLFFFLTAGVVAFGQDLSLSFMSQTDAKFFVYLNGKLQNETSSGLVKINNLEDKDYHVRIVVDDPFLVATTTTLRPDVTKNEYTVNFNAVRERVYVKPAKKEQPKDNETLVEEKNIDTTTAPTPIPPKTTKKRKSEPEPTGTTGNNIRTVKNTVVVDD